MRLSFDRGTLLFTNVPPDVDLGRIDGVRYDPRVYTWRARACDHDGIVQSLRLLNIAVDDVASRVVPLSQLPPPLELRPYQEQALASWEKAHRRGVVVLPTGAGKTRVAIAAIGRTRTRSLVLVPTRVLLEQWRDELAVAGFLDVGKYGDAAHEMGPVTVATIESAWRWMHRLGDAFDLVVVDEVHRISGIVHSEALEMTLARYRLGLTATMCDGDGAHRINRLVGPIVHLSTVDELAGRYLAPFELVVVPVELLRTERDVYEGHMRIFRDWAADQTYIDPELKFEALAKRARRTPEGRAALDALRRAHRVLTYPAQKHALLGELLREHAHRKVLVFTPNNRTAYAIAREHLIAPITCDISKAERAAIMGRFRDGTLRALVSSQVLNEGVDVPDADVAVVVGGRAGEREHVQRIGRVLRPSSGKQALVIELIVARTNEVYAGRRRRQFLASAAGAEHNPARDGAAE